VIQFLTNWTVGKQLCITVDTVERRRWPTWLRSRTRHPMTNGLALLAHRSVQFSYVASLCTRLYDRLQFIIIATMQSHSTYVRHAPRGKEVESIVKADKSHYIIYNCSSSSDATFFPVDLSVQNTRRFSDRSVFSQLIWMLFFTSKETTKLFRKLFLSTVKFVITVLFYNYVTRCKVGITQCKFYILQIPLFCQLQFL